MKFKTMMKVMKKFDSNNSTQQFLLQEVQDYCKSNDELATKLCHDIIMQGSYPNNDCIRRMAKFFLHIKFNILDMDEKGIIEFDAARFDNYLNNFKQVIDAVDAELEDSHTIAYKDYLSRNISDIRIDEIIGDYIKTNQTKYVTAYSKRFTGTGRD